MAPKKKETLTHERLKELLRYDPDAGVFTWRVARPAVAAGTVAGGVDHQGYHRIKVGGRTYQRSRLAWLYVNGDMPIECIDHRNGARSDDRICNLRHCSISENNQNLGLTRANKSGVMGVSWKSSHHRWCAQIKHLGKVVHLGLFDKIEDAAAARATAKASLHTFNPVDASRRGVPVC